MTCRIVTAIPNGCALENKCSILMQESGQDHSAVEDACNNMSHEFDVMLSASLMHYTVMLFAVPSSSRKDLYAACRLRKHWQLVSVTR